MIEDMAKRDSGQSTDLLMHWHGHQLVPVLVILAILFMAVATRFHRLGWSFSGDEAATFAEVESLFSEPYFQDNLHPYNCQPHAQPASYLLQAAVYKIVGRGEFAARSGVAMAGVLSIVLVVVLAWTVWGRLTAMLAGAILILWPWHLGMSQSNRVYMYGFLFSSTALLLGARAWQRNNFTLGAIAGILSAAAIASHNTAVLVPVSLGIWCIVEAIPRRVQIAGKAVLGYVIAGVPPIAAASLLGYMAMRSWESQQSWGSGPFRVLMGYAYAAGWPIFVTAGMGGVLAWTSRNAADRLIAITAGVSVIACAVAPMCVAFRQSYVFVVAAAIVLLAARTMEKASVPLKDGGVSVVGLGLSIVLILTMMPSFASHYQDGSRKDYRSAAAYITEHSQPDDVVVSVSAGALRHYLDRKIRPCWRLAHSPERSIQVLKDAVSTGRRVWFVHRSSREEPPQWAYQWLSSHSMLMLRIKKDRFDYSQNHCCPIISRIVAIG